MEFYMEKSYAKAVLERFLSHPLSSAHAVLEEFASLPGAISHINSEINGEKRSFVYIPGARKDRALLVAHADTVWDWFYTGRTFEQILCEENGIYKGEDQSCGIGADDRAGCAILWLLKDSGHSLLVVDGEEHGQIGSNYIKSDYPEIYDELNSHSYMIQFDRRENKNYKVYNIPVSREFIQFVEENTGYYNAGNTARTDIVTLCRDICGVNLSIGYYNEHTPDEYLNFEEWLETLNLAGGILKNKQKTFVLDKTIVSL